MHNRVGDTAPTTGRNLPARKTAASNLHRSAIGNIQEGELTLSMGILSLLAEVIQELRALWTLADFFESWCPAVFLLELFLPELKQ